MNKAAVVYQVEGEPFLWPQLQAELALPANWLTRLPTGAVEMMGGELYRFWFVGVLGAGRHLLVVLPKYLTLRTDAEWLVPGHRRIDEARLLLQVLRIYLGRPAATPTLTEGTEAQPPTDFAAGEPTVALGLIDDYLLHGYWQPSQTTLTTWEGARPDWQRTMERSPPLLTETGPIYPVRYGIRYATNAASLLAQLHRWAVRHCLETYGNLLPGFDQVSYDQEAAAEMSEIGEPEMLEQFLDRETRTTFQDGQLRTLRLLRQLVTQTAQAAAEAKVSLFGTINFPRVWEVVCQHAFADRRSELSSRLPIPTWHRNEPATTYQNTGNRLIPDLVWFDDHTLLIGDAKYYTVRFGEKGGIVGAPGMPDLTKQLLYEQALTAILQEPGQALRQVYNVFIMPTARLASRNELAKDWHWGTVQTNIPTWEGRHVGVWFIPPATLFECYVAGCRLSWL